MDDSNAVLVRLVQQNDPVAFTRLFGRHYAMVFDRCLRMLGHRQDAEDATQETFSRAVRYLHRWDPRRPLEPWLITIAGNRCRTLLSQRRSVLSLSDPDGNSTQEQAASRIAMERQQRLQAAESLQEEVQRAVGQLPKNHRLAFELFHEQGLSYDQIAEQLGCAIGTAKTWVHRARANLMKQLCDRNVVRNTSPRPDECRKSSTRSEARR